MEYIYTDGNKKAKKKNKKNHPTPKERKYYTSFSKKPNNFPIFRETNNILKS